MQDKHTALVINVGQVDRPVGVHHIAGQVGTVPGQQAADIDYRPAIDQNDALDVIVGLAQGTQEGGDMTVALNGHQGVRDVVGTKEVGQGAAGTEGVHVGGDQDEDGAGPFRERKGEEGKKRGVETYAMDRTKAGPRIKEDRQTYPLNAFSRSC